MLRFLILSFLLASAHLTAREIELDDNFLTDEVDMSRTVRTVNDEHLTLQQRYKLLELMMQVSLRPDWESELMSYVSQITQGESLDNNHIVDLLQSNFCVTIGLLTMNEIEEHGLSELFSDPKNIIHLKYKNLNTPVAPELKIPYILHHIWLTHPSSPREIRHQDIHNVIYTHRIFTRAASNTPWRHIIWTNNLKLIPNSVQILQRAGIEVRSIYEYQNSLSLFPLVEGLIEGKDWGMASDILRYSLIQKFGGVYSDLNYIFNRDTTSENHKYNFFSLSHDVYLFENCLLGASPNHPIINKAIELIERNIMHPPQYLQDVWSNALIRTSLATVSPLATAYYTQCNQNGNIDVVYPVTPTSDLSEEGICMSEFFSLCFEYLNKPQYAAVSTLVESLAAIEICPTEDEYIGHDSPDGFTWVDN